MIKELDKIIESIVHLPFECINKNESIYFLLQKSGYFELNDQIYEEKIAEMLTLNPETIDYWLTWSENKRSDSGLYFTKDEKGKCIVGYYPEKSNFRDIEFSDEFKACAAFIIKEIETIRTRSNPDKIN